MEPIRPEEVTALKKRYIPDDVFAVVNQLIAKYFSNDEATIKQDEIISLLEQKGYTRYDIFDNHYLDFEDIYREYGWEVVYDKPSYYDNYDAYFKFKESKKR